MAFTLPTFNLTANIWRHGNPTSNPPDVVTVANLAYGERTSVPYAVTTTSTTVYGGMWLLCPKGTDIRDDKAPAGSDTVEVPAGTGRFYDVVWVDDAGAGFDNEHRFALIISTSPWPVPFPSPTPPSPPGPSPIDAGVLGPGVFITYNVPFGGSPGTGVLVMCTLSPGTGGGHAAVSSLVLGPLTSMLVTGGPSFGIDTSAGDIYVFPVAGPGDVLTFTAPGNVYVLYNFYFLPNPSYTLDVFGVGASGTPSLVLTSGGPTTTAGDVTIAIAFGADSTSITNWTGGVNHNGANDVFQVGAVAHWFLASATQFTPIAITPTVTVTNTFGGFGSAWNGGIICIF